MGNIRHTEEYAREELRARQHHHQQHHQRRQDQREEYQPDLAVFAQRLQAMRDRRGINRKALGELCGLSKNIIGMYERGEKDPSVETLVTLAEFFDVSVDYLLGREKFF